MKVLLIQPLHYYDGKTRPPTNFPIGLGYIAKVLVKFGHDVDVLDIWAHQYSNDQVLEKIKGIDHDVVGISALSTQYRYVKWLTSELKKHCRDKTKIVVGGALATLSPEIVLKNTQTDICVIGEGEVTFREVVENTDSLETIEGICFKQGGKIVRTPPREYIKNLDSIEFPAWDLFLIETYIRTAALDLPVPEPGVRTMSIIAGRGCPYNCRFCSKTFSGLRLRSVDNVIQEIKELIKRYDIARIHFCDELVLVNKKGVYELCDKIEKLNIKWQCQGKVNLVDLDLLKRMKEAGCIAVGYGVESGSQKILDNMNKQQTVEQAKRAIRDAVEVGLHPIVQMIFGYPGETRETLRETIAFFEETPYVGRVPFFVSTPIPGTELYHHALEKGLITDEEKFLEQLEVGYNYLPGRPPLVNFTRFSEEEFHRFYRETEDTITIIEAKKSPFRFAKTYLLPYIRKFGLIQTIKRIALKQLPVLKR
jgi:radical SAM superfamily enzyme YgiQ (UPF0313 family)